LRIGRPYGDDHGEGRSGQSEVLGEELISFSGDLHFLDEAGWYDANDPPRQN
jgi:hypothetical protein